MYHLELQVNNENIVTSLLVLKLFFLYFTFEIFIEYGSKHVLRTEKS